METESVKTIHVLLIEDVAEDAYVVRRLLRDIPGRAYTVTVASTEAEAQRALTQPFDVCLLDLKLGASSGFDVLSAVSLPELPGPVIVLTGMDASEADDSVYGAGVADFLSKSELSSSVLDRTIRYTRRQFDAAREFRFLAQHDELTRLFNRRYFHHRLETTMRERGDTPVAVFYIDLDGFKTINDTWGHDLGDAILCEASARLSACFRRSDCVARYGGDEFVALLEPALTDSVDAVVRKLVTSMRKPIVVGEQNFTVTASVGVAIARPEDDADELIRKADHAMYVAKSSGRDAWHVFSDDEAVKARNRGSLATDLRQALTDDELYLVFQPVVRPATGEVCGAEALMRWEHPELGPIAVGEILSLAEEVGLIRSLSNRVVERAVDAMPALIEGAPDDFWVSINIAPQQLTQPGFADELSNALRRQNIPHKRVRLELTERALLGADSASLDAIQRLHECGAGLLIDDFGSGHSSLSYLARLPVQGIKLAGQFLEAVPDAGRNDKLVRAMLRLAESLSIEVVVEGVETQAQHDFLAAEGCPAVQGFHYAPGVPLSRFQQYAADAS